MTGFADVKDADDADDVELSDNIAEDVVEYLRGSIVGHEQEGLLMYLATLSGWGYEEGFHTNVIGIGPPGSGKSLTKNTIGDVLPDRDTYTKTDASSNAILDSVEWDLSLVAVLDEYDKIDRNIIEVLKSANPEDGGYAKDRNVEDEDAVGGYSPTEVSADANPWIVLYAPSSKKGGINDELEDRALVLYFSNSKHTRRGILRKEFGHEDINLTSDEHDHEYIYDTHALSVTLRDRVRSLPTDTHREEIDGEMRVVSRTGDTLVYMPKWVVYAVEPIFNIDEDYANRTFSIVDNLIKGSALLNHDRRATTTVEVYVDDDSSETDEREAVVVGPQDVANVLSCYPTLLSTTHQLTPLKRNILDAVRSTEPDTDADGTTVSKVQTWLEDNDIPHPSRSTLKSRLDDLAEDYYLDRYKSCAGPKGQADAYQIAEHGALKVPRLYDLQRHADRDGIELATEDCVAIDPEEPFVDCSDPIRDQDFTQTVREFEAEFVGEDIDEDADEDILADAMGGDPDGDVTDHTDDGQTQQTLDGDVADPEDTGGGSSTLDPKGQPDDLTEQHVYEAVQSQAGELFSSSHSVAHYIGAVDPEVTVSRADTTDTALDPDHELWDVRPDLADDRVISEEDALRELDEAFGRLQQKELVALDDDGGPPAMSVLRVAEAE